MDPRQNGQPCIRHVGSCYLHGIDMAFLIGAPAATHANALQTTRIASAQPKHYTLSLIRNMERMIEYPGTISSPIRVANAPGFFLADRHMLVRLMPFL